MNMVTAVEYSNDEFQAMKLKMAYKIIKPLFSYWYDARCTMHIHDNLFIFY